MINEENVFGEEEQEKPKSENPNKEILASLGFAHYEKISDLMKNREGSYFLVNVVARRASEISKGSKPLVNVDDPTGECYPFAYVEAKEDKLVAKPKAPVNKLVDVINERS